MSNPTTFHWILVVDLENFSSRSHPIQESLRAAMYDVLRGGTDDAHLTWDDWNVADRGDGLLIIIPPTVPPDRLAGALISALDQRIAEKARMYSEAHSMRMRVSLHCGLVSFDAHGTTGDAVNIACRLVDLPVLRTVLRTCERANLAFIVSDDVFRSVVAQGFRSIDSATYRLVRFDVKNLVDFPAWIHVPGYPTPRGLPPNAGGPAENGSPTAEFLLDGGGRCAARPGPDEAAGAYQQNGGFHFSDGSTITVHGDQVAGDKNVRR